MNNKERLDLANWVVKTAQKAGARDVAANIGKFRQISIEHRNRKLDVLNESTQNSLGLDVYINNRYSTYATCDLRKESLSRFIGEAVAMTKYLGEDIYRTLPDPKYYEGVKAVDLRIFDQSYDSMTSEKRVRLAKEIEEAALSQSENVVACTAYYNDFFAESVKVHSNGFDGMRQATSFSIGLEVTVCDDKECRPNDDDYLTVRYIKDIPDHQKMAVAAVKRAFSKIGQKKMVSGKFDMIVENRSGARLISALLGPMRASAVQQKGSCLEGMLGKKIASDKLTLIDDPLLENGLGSRLYDDEGMAAKRRIMIEKGILKSFYVDTYYGRKLSWEPTVGDTSNMTFECGTKSVDEMIAQMGKGIFVTNFIGGNSNSTTGDFSYGIIGQYIENGKMVHPINEMNVSGNILDLWPKLVEVGNDPYIYSQWRRPSMYFKDVEFSGV